MSDSWGLAGGDLIAPGLTAVRPVGGGEVFEAWSAFDERLHAPVVVKVVPRAHDNAGSRAGLLREVEMLSRLNHPGIVREQPDDPWVVEPRQHLDLAQQTGARTGVVDVPRAHDLDDDRRVETLVVKVVRPGHDLDDAGSRAGLLREVEMLSRLNHPGIVRLFAYDDEAPRPYLVLENIDGPTLSSLIAKHGYLPLHQLLPLGLELCSALHYLRHENVCHLDVKPSNVIMGAPAKLIDLSIAMDVSDARSLDHPVGSDEYMAPEQCVPGVGGRSVDHASDMWAFGATMFRAAAGYRAYDREPRWQQLTAAPKALPHFVPRALSDLIVSCLATTPGDRPMPSEAAQALEPLMERLPQARLSGFKISL